MVNRDWSRRDVLKSVGTGVVGAGVGGFVLDRLDQYIVGTDASAGVRAAASVSTTETRRIDLTEYTGTTLVCGVFSRARRETLLARDDVGFVQPDRKLQFVGSEGNGDERQTATGTLPWGIDRVDADVAHAEGATGEGVDVAVIDGGIDDSHPAVAENLADPNDDANHESWVACEGDCNYDWSDDGGHGTHVAGIAAAAGTPDGTIGVAPEATLHALKVCGARGGCRTSAVAEAVRYAADQGWDVANLSLGTARPSPALQAAGEYAQEADLLPVAAAGNRGRPDSVAYPAAYDEYLAVSATTIEDRVADFSSTGPEVDLAAPGKDVCSATVDGYDLLSGTSMAAPHVAGAAALLAAEGASASEARTRLAETAEDIGASDTQQGAGLVDAAAASGYDSADDGTGDGTACPDGS
ncbi:MAG: S8 family serine peptidase [Halobaculum sp.]